MDKYRRKLIASTGAIGLASAITPAAALAQAIYGARASVKDNYASRMHDWFYLHDANDKHQGNLQLIEVQDEKSNKQVDQFSLLFQSYRQAVAMPSGYYRVAAESFDLFVKHVGEQDGRHLYRANFALLRRPFKKGFSR